MDTLDERLLREWVGKRLKNDDVPDRLWAHLKRKHYVSEVLEGFISREDLLEEARKQIKISCEIADEWREGGAFPGDREDISASIEHTSTAGEKIFTDYERDRGIAFAEYLAKLAKRNPAVANFRTRILGVDALTLDQIRDLLTSPALRFLPPHWFFAEGVPMLDNRIQVIGQEWRPRPDFPELEALIVRLKLPDARETSQKILERNRDNKQPDVLVLPRVEGLRGGEVPVWPGSILGILHKLSVALAQKFTWREGAAAWFLLTDETPRVPLLDWSDRRHVDGHFQHYTISMTVAPWISADTLARFWRFYQRGHFGGNNRPLSARNMAVFRFVIGNAWPHPDGIGVALSKRGVTTSVAPKGKASALATPPWRTLLDLWNRNHPEWAYKDVRLFSRDFHRARRLISGSNYQE